ncbi:MAG: hypothetical protein EAX96_01585 [Candidatus Lokiarchaeota archaeon]|nr:hypothetical protein [Candidatus Lokiarchaeota archaeon]
MLILILNNESDDKNKIPFQEIVESNIPIIEKIGDFLFEMLKLKKEFLLDSIEIQNIELKKDTEITLILENKYGSDLKINYKTLNLTLPKEHVNHLLIGGILIYITERKVLHPIIEAPSWVKGLREERFVEFELDEDFVEEEDLEKNLPRLMFKVAKKEDILYNFLYAVSRGLLILINSPK